ILLAPERRAERALWEAQRLLARAVQRVEVDMVGKDYLIGDFSAADTMLGHSIMMSQRMGVVTDEHPNLTAYIERLKARPALQKAFEFDAV
ncbi:MAG: glutathione binding-like protein, partial [Alphaproteobacteria bacterium]|nr:glutathione binding-like protein [Alphaproteobacteria bacterium]